jgi:hypothetical protein
MIEHTPGPWKDFVDDDGYLIVQMDAAHTVMLGDMESTCGTCHANARLIAAAPELLDALEGLLGIAADYMENTGKNPNDFFSITDARAVIAKAKGEDVPA